MIIEFKNVMFGYPGNKPLLHIPQWQVQKGEHVFVHGPSGSGKSTLLNLMSGILKPHSGELSVLRQRIDQMNSRQRDRFRGQNIGYVFQQFNLMPYLNAVENVELATCFQQKTSLSQKSQMTMNEIQILLQKLNMDEQHWNKPASHLSIGQQQRVAIARALIKKPGLLIADEPTSSLDTVNRDKFMSELLKITNEHETTLVFVSHDMSLSSYFKQTVALAEINTISSVMGI